MRILGKTVGDVLVRRSVYTAIATVLWMLYGST